MVTFQDVIIESVWGGDGGPNSKNSNFVDIVFIFHTEMSLHSCLYISLFVDTHPHHSSASAWVGRADSQKLNKAKQQSSNSIAQHREGKHF
jgi:hypothetical protein